jgi:hypothetical protein
MGNVFLTLHMTHLFIAAVVTYYFKMKPGQIKKFPGLSPPANYTDQATAACRRS